MARWQDYIVNKLTSGFGLYGRWLVRHQRLVVGIVSVVFVVCTLGLVFLESESDAEYLFIPRGTKANEERDRHRALFGTNGTSRATLMFVGQGEYTNLWQRDRVQAMLELHNEVMSLENAQGKVFKDICVRDAPGECQISSILRCLGFQLPGKFPTVMGYPTCISPQNRTLYIKDHVVNIELNSEGQLTLVQVLSIEYTVLPEFSTQWELDVFLKFMDNRVKSFNDEHKDILRVTYSSRLALDRALQDGQLADMPLVVGAFFLIVVFTTVTNAKWKDGDALHRMLPANAAVWISLCAVGPAWGILSAAGIPFIAMNGVILFLTVGIGIDDMFILVSSYNRLPKELPLEERMGRTLEEAGVAITVTTLTDILAFAIGIASPFRSVQIFSTYTALSIFFDYILQLSIFLVILTYDESRSRTDSRILKKLKDVASTGWSRLALCQPNDSRQDPSPTMIMKSIEDSLFSIPNQDYVGRLQDRLTARWSLKAFSNNYCSAVVLLFYVAYVGASIVGILNLGQGLRLAQLASDDSHLADFDNVETKYFDKQNGIPIHVVITGELPFWEKNVRSGFRSLLQHLVDESSFIESKNEVWITSFEKAREVFNSEMPETDQAGEDMSESQFRLILGIMLDRFDNAHELRADMSLIDPLGNMYEPGDLVGPTHDLLQNENVKMQALKAFVQSIPPLGDTTRQTDIMKASRDALASSAMADAYGSQIFVFSPWFVFYEQSAAILSSTTFLLGTAVVSMLAVALILLPTLKSVALVVTALTSIFAGVVGFMHHWGLTLNTITMINLLIAIGFSIDFTSHVIHAFLHAEGYNRVLTGDLLTDVQKRTLNSMQKSPNEGFVQHNVELEEDGTHCKKILESPVEHDNVNDTKLETTIKSIVRDLVGIPGPYSPTGTDGHPNREELCGGNLRKLRSAQALTYMGRPLLNGGVSTILGISLLAAGSTFIFRAFFRVLFLVLVFGLMHGIILIPIALRLCGPKMQRHATSRSETGTTDTDDNP